VLLEGKVLLAPGVKPGMLEEFIPELDIGADIEANGLLFRISKKEFEFTICPTSWLISSDGRRLYIDRILARGA